MTPSDQQDQQDNFARLIEHRAEIAEFVNSFTSERVQRKAFHAVVCSLGLAPATSSGSQVAAPAEGLRIVKSAPDAEVDSVPAVDPPEDAKGEAPRRRRSGSRKNFSIVRGLVFAPEGHQTFEAFVAEKDPKNNDERILVSVFYLAEMMGIAEVGIGHILAAYQEASWSAPAHPDTAVRAAASRTGWLDTADTKAIKVLWKGENYLTTKMPAEPKKKSG